AGPQPGQPPPPRLPVIAVIGNGLWKRRFGSDPSIVGRTVDLGNGRAQIVGVLGPEFELLFAPRANMERTPDMWTANRINYELAVCAAIGGTRWQLVRQMLAESLLIAGAGTLLGVGLARAGVELLITLAPKDVPRLTDVAVDPIALAFAIGTGAITAILCGIV